MKYGVWIIAGSIVVILVLLVILLLRRRKIEENIESEDFDDWKAKIDAGCDEDTLRSYISFLKKYGGGYVRRRNKTVIERRFRGQELEDLKSIFTDIIVPSVKLGIKLKEEFRECILELGVIGVENRPLYEQSNGQSNYVDEFDEEKRKLAKTRATRIIRACLRKLNPHRFTILQDIELEYEGEKRKIDHIIIGDNAVFILETKSYGLSDEEDEDETSLYIDKSDRWLIRKYYQMYEVPSPNAKMEDLQRYMKNFCLDLFLDVECIMVIANPELKMKQNLKTNYAIAPVTELVKCVENYRGVVTEMDKEALVDKINKYRTN